MPLCDRCDNHATAVITAPGRRPERVKLCAKCEQQWERFKASYTAAQLLNQIRRWPR